MVGEDELEELRRRKMLEMQRGVDEQRESEEQRRAQETEKARKQQILRQILAPDARERLANVRLVRPDLAENVENQLIQLASMGRINRLLTDVDIRDVLAKLTESKRETKIERR
ncbi:MAG: DNA-binding protein [Candidatus Thermoplasmatota archaeon]|nr:DNA-binding protein [Candidatus Thermoplasmatota archaeon]MCL6091231.1 DNA-binding protein [Candidatus Thermoplasmatota archaeon]MDA8142952.1 DNA-binding protein [Thermoplasmatales archaeon]